jgi:hypothetical protein
MGMRRLKTGDVLELSSSSGRKGLATVLRRDDFGLLTRLRELEPLVPGHLKRETTVYVNPCSLRGWRVVERQAQCESCRVPVFFYGSSATAWTIQASDGDRYVRGSDVSVNSLRAQGYTHKVLWLGENLERWLDGEPLEWRGAL